MLISLHGTLKIRNLADIKTWARAFTRLTCRPMERRFSKPPAISRADRPKYLTETLFWPAAKLCRRFGEPPFHRSARQSSDMSARHSGNQTLRRNS